MFKKVTIAVLATAALGAFALRASESSPFQTVTNEEVKSLYGGGCWDETTMNCIDYSGNDPKCKGGEGPWPGDKRGKNANHGPAKKCATDASKLCVVIKKLDPCQDAEPVPTGF